jgi:hypothetical protein
MLYLGHFSFDEIGSEQEIRHGYFTCVVESQNAEGAVNEFKELVISMKETQAMFKRITAVYMDDMVEFRNIPKKAIVARIQSSTGEFPESVSRSLPGVVTPGINIYGLAPEIKEDEKKADQEGYKEARPFVKFGGG